MAGGDTSNVNHHMSVRAQRYGIDFMRVAGQSGRELKKGTGRSLEDYYSWDAEVLSPVSGQVILVTDGLPDNLIGTKDTKNPAGNYIVIKISEERYVFVAHLKNGSVVPKKGQKIKVGDVIGLCGNSGNSDFPHIHLHMQNRPKLNKGLGLNMVFSEINVEMNGKLFSSVTWPLIKGLFISNTKQ